MKNKSILLITGITILTILILIGISGAIVDNFDDNVINTTRYNTFRDACDGGSLWAEAGGEMSATCTSTTGDWNTGVQFRRFDGVNWSENTINLTIDFRRVKSSTGGTQFQFGWAQEGQTGDTIGNNVKWIGSRYSNSASGTINANITWLVNRTDVGIFVDGSPVATLIRSNATNLPTFDITDGAGNTAELHLRRLELTNRFGEVITQLNSPANNTATANATVFFNATVSTNRRNLTNATLFIYNSDGSIFNNTVTNTIAGEISNTTVFAVNTLVLGSFEWNVFGCGSNATTTVCSFAQSNRTFNYGYEIISSTFNLEAFETERELFEFNITTIPEVLSVSAILNYNGTANTAIVDCDGVNCSLSASIDIPIIRGASPEFKNFSFETTFFTATTSFTANLSSGTQNVSQIFFTECNATISTRAINFTALDEQTNNRIIPFYSAGTFDFWLGNGNIRKQFSYSNLSATELGLCISPPDRTFFIDDTIEYNDVINSTIYTTRNYFFQNSTINNVTLNVPLFLLLTSESTSFILKVQDNNLLPIRNVLITSQRFNVGTGNFSIVQIAKTDDRGQSIGFFQTETVDYRFLITDQGRLLLQTLPQKIVGETAPFTLTFTIGEGVGKPWELFEDLPNLEVSLIYNRSSGNVVFTYIDTSGEFTLARLLVENQSLSSFGSEIICDINSFQSSGILTCNVGNVTESYIASGFITRGNNVFLVRLINFAVELFTAVIGLLGVFLGWFIILISAFAFKFNELAGIWIVNAAVIFVNMIQLISFGFVFIFAMIAVSIMITIMFNKPQ